MPRPIPSETQSEFIRRAVREFLLEGFSKDEALGRAYGFWKTYKKKKSKPD